MGTLACKMCAAPLKIYDDGIFARCSYCGMSYTLPFEDETEEDRITRAEPVLAKAKMYLKDGRFDDAADSFERVLDITPSNGEAYLGKGLALLRIKTPAELRAIKRKALQNYYIKKAMLFTKGDQKSELYDALGLKAKLEWSSMPLNRWRTEVLSERKRFLHDLRELYRSNDEHFENEIDRIEEKYADDLSVLTSRLETIDNEMADIREKLQKHPTVDEVIEADNKLRRLEEDKSDVERELSIIRSRKSYEIKDSSEEFSETNYRISRVKFFELAKEHTLPGFAHDENESIVDKVYDVLLSEYEFLSISEIMSRELIRGQSERRVEAAVRKLILDKRIIAVSIDGIECYAPSDMQGIEIEE